MDGKQKRRPGLFARWRMVPSVAVGGNDVRLLRNGENCFPAMLEAIEGARREILLDMYWFASDRTGRTFADALSRKARDGVRVLVIYDSLGSIGVDTNMFDAMVKDGCEVHEYNPLAPWRRQYRFGRARHRDHRKILVVDGRIGFTGGLNIGDQWAPQDAGGQEWRDEMVRIEGPAALALRETFYVSWRGLGKEPNLGPPVELGSLRPPPPSAEKAPVGPVVIHANATWGERRTIRLAYLKAIRSASKTIYIANSYFVPDRVIRMALMDAKRRGVDVRVVLPGVSDVPAVYWAARNLYTRFLKAGVRIFEWQRTVFHSKYAVIDGHWCTVGTYNLDYLSWRWNLEVNVAITDDTLGATMNEYFADDLAHCVEVKLEAFRTRPIYERFAEKFFYFFRKLL